MSVPNALVEHVHDVAKIERAKRKLAAARQRKLLTLVDDVGVQQVLVMLASIMGDEQSHIDEALRGDDDGD